jgi:hypothetical protein
LISFMKLKIDHVTIAGRELARIEDSFAAIGLKPDYGGLHSNGITQMSLLGFDDGSYIELISKVEGGKFSPWWDNHIENNGGPCAWAVEVDDVAGEVARVSALGVSVRGPFYYNRRRPDGVLVEWDLALLGDHPEGAKLPFIIKDRTPREYRVSPSSTLSGTELKGVKKVILGVKDLDSSINQFRLIYNWSAPLIIEDIELQTTLADFGQTPVILASPSEERCWLAERLIEFGESPCAFLIGSDNIEMSRRRLPLGRSVSLPDQTFYWIEPSKLDGIRIGIINSYSR